MEQPALAQARSAQSPLAALRQSARYGRGTRGLDADELPQQQFGLVSWRVVSKHELAAKP